MCARFILQGLFSQLGLAERRVAAPVGPTAFWTDIFVDKGACSVSTLQVALCPQASLPVTDREVLLHVDFDRCRGLASVAL